MPNGQSSSVAAVPLLGLVELRVWTRFTRVDWLFSPVAGSASLMDHRRREGFPGRPWIVGRFLSVGNYYRSVELGRS
ncbi:unnamed protein product [Macrosiphum euphorbiae]|uniref:Uncharacterized protein n=1 Tax=Macrosiphum euphorbiae TaxID=13131 RepID=A0AAV0WFY0_9HEMI|nr:unnamed protein product [Macrosiphum euphorbiae]